WVIDQMSEGVVPLFLSGATISGDTITYAGEYQESKLSFNNVAASVASAREQLSVAPVTYPLSGADVLPTRPEWFNQPYGANAHLDVALDVQETGDIAHQHPTVEADLPHDEVQDALLADLQDQIDELP